MLIAEFSMAPIGAGESVGRYVAKCVNIVDKSGLPYKLGPMGTCIEGAWDQVFGVMKKCLDELAKDCNRVSISIKVDYRTKNTGGALESKVESIEKRIGRKLKT